MQSLRCVGLRGKGHGNMRGMLPGFTFHLTGYPLDEVNAEYLVLCTKLTLVEVGQVSGTAQEFRCETEFEIQPANEYYRMPLETPLPMVVTERAIVTGPDGHIIWTDAQGRIRLQPVPDRKGNFDEDSFIWVTPLQQWQNGQLGTFAVPRIGSEVVLGYINGNPDMPVMLGSLVNAHNLPGWELPHNQWLSGMRSRMDGSLASNHLALDDTRDKQQAQLASDHGKSSLSLGYNTRIDGNKGRQDARGEGFELRTKIIGRAPGPVGAQGRKDAVYGDLWFFVPKGTKFFANEPHPYREDGSAPAIGSLHPQAPVAAAGTSCDMVVRMHYEKDCTLTTYLKSADDSWSVSAAMAPESEAEYNLYKRATELAGRYGSSSLGNITAGMAVPSPSAIFEMIRFGRCIQDQLPQGASFNHWRKVKTPDGDGWINLSRANVRAYSDADFPEWAGWSFISDDPTPDSLCDSPTVKSWLDLNHTGHVRHADAVGALANATVRERVARAVCKFPSEWCKAGLEARYNWLKSPHDALNNPLSETDFVTLMNHAKDLAFWDEITDPDFPPANECWHFPPTAFIRSFNS
ncbi:type VI secretion system tip protein VgrG [Paraburkholderia sp. J7]|uniref:type VI secretion system Vgr family protein n=1 Tax=Paraburkholderia sp. J7 TaxID=2805438 RepID=UPI002AB6086F|nr:type VI secretion system tip protein VgrG [Paraburkholderia sp. J7]